MRSSDVNLFREIKHSLDGYVQDQETPEPIHKLGNVALEMHGVLADMLYVDHVENEALIVFLIAMLNMAKDQEGYDLLEFLKVIQKALGTIIEHNVKPS